MDKATVIVGGEGTGKTTLAVKMAKEKGSFISTTYPEISSYFGMSRAMVDNPKVVIIEEMPPTQEAWSFAKHVTSCSTFMVESKGQDPREIDTPVFIFTSQMMPPLSPNQRRFNIIKLGE